MSTALPETIAPPVQTPLETLSHEVAASIANTGGATVMMNRTGNPYLLTPDTFQPETYIVGGIAEVREYAVDLASDPVMVELILMGAINDRLNDHSALGFWVHEGVVHVEATETFTVEEMARTASQERGELAYYALKAQETVFV